MVRWMRQRSSPHVIEWGCPHSPYTDPSGLGVHSVCTHNKLQRVGHNHTTLRHSVHQVGFCCMLYLTRNECYPRCRPAAGGSVSGASLRCSHKADPFDRYLLSSLIGCDLSIRCWPRTVSRSALRPSFTVPQPFRAFIRFVHFSSLSSFSHTPLSTSPTPLNFL